MSEGETYDGLYVFKTPVTEQGKKDQLWVSSTLRRQLQAFDKSVTDEPLNWSQSHKSHCSLVQDHTVHLGCPQNATVIPRSQ